MLALEADWRTKTTRPCDVSHDRATLAKLYLPAMSM